MCCFKLCSIGVYRGLIVATIFFLKFYYFYGDFFGFYFLLDYLFAEEYRCCSRRYYLHYVRENCNSNKRRRQIIRRVRWFDGRFRRKFKVYKVYTPHHPCHLYPKDYFINFLLLIKNLYLLNKCSNN